MTKENKKACTPEEMSQALHKLTLRWDPLEEILNRPRNRCIVEPIPGKKMKVVPIGAIEARKVNGDIFLLSDGTKIQIRESRRQKLRKFINRLTPLSIAIGSAVLSTQLLLLSLKLSGLLNIDWWFVFAPTAWPGLFLIGYDAAAWIYKGIRGKNE